MEEIVTEVKAWQNHRNNKNSKINWQFTNDKARIKLKRLYLFSLRFNTSRLASGSKNIFFNASWACPEDYLPVNFKLTRH